jgi:hypothetical protein
MDCVHRITKNINDRCADFDKKDIKQHIMDGKQLDLSYKIP